MKNAAQQKWRDRQHKGEDEEIDEISQLPPSSAPLPAIENPLMFGVPLENTMEPGETLPRVIFETIQNILDRKAYLEEGLFRLSASHSQLQVRLLFCCCLH